MSRKSNTEQRRSEIVNALLAAIAEHGYEKATIHAIAEKAGLSPGLIHYHFKSKKEILIDLVKTLAAYSSNRYLQFAESAKTPEEKLHAYIKGRLAKGPGASSEIVAAWVVIGTEAVRQPEVREVYQEAVAAELALAHRLLSACLANQGKKTTRAAQLAASLLAFMEGAFQLASAAGDIMPQGYAAPVAVQLMERFISAEPVAPGRRS